MPDPSTVDAWSTHVGSRLQETLQDRPIFRGGRAAFAQAVAEDVRILQLEERVEKLEQQLKQVRQYSVILGADGRRLPLSYAHPEESAFMVEFFAWEETGVAWPDQPPPSCFDVGPCRINEEAVRRARFD